MKMFYLIIILNCVYFGVHSASFSPKCKLGRECVTKHTAEIYKSLFDDDSNGLDPMDQKIIEGDLATLKYILRDTTITGYQKCSVKSADLDLKNLMLEVHLYCPEFHVRGTYEASGFLIVMPVQGNGGYTIDTKAYDIKIKMGVSLVPKGDKQHLRINNFNMDTIPLEGVTFNFENLFNGQKDLVDKFLAFVNENWKDIANLIQGPVFRANLKKIVKATNTFFTMHPLDDFIQL